jgi:hypothetical protein
MSLRENTTQGKFPGSRKYKERSDFRTSADINCHSAFLGRKKWREFQSNIKFVFLNLLSKVLSAIFSA